MLLYIGYMLETRSTSILPLQQSITVNGLSQAFKGDVLLLQSQACENPVYWLLKVCSWPLTGWSQDLTCLIPVILQACKHSNRLVMFVLIL